MELVIKPGCYAELLVTDITVSVRGYIGDCTRPMVTVGDEGKVFNWWLGLWDLWVEGGGVDVDVHPPHTLLTEAFVGIQCGIC